MTASPHAIVHYRIADGALNDGIVTVRLQYPNELGNGLFSMAVNLSSGRAAGHTKDVELARKIIAVYEGYPVESIIVEDLFHGETN